MYIVETEKRYNWLIVLLNVCLCDLKNGFSEKCAQYKEDSLHKTTRPELRENQTNKKINDHKNTS